MSQPKFTMPPVKMAVTVEQLREMVITQHKSDAAIGRELGVCSVTVSNWRRRYGIDQPPRIRSTKQQRRPRRKCYLTKDQLEDMYVRQGLSQKQIAKRSGLHQVSISNWFKKFNIQSRPDGGRQAIFLPEDELRRLYVSEELTMGVIAKHFGCGESTVRQNLIRFGLQIGGAEVARRRLARNLERYPREITHREYKMLRHPEHPLADKNGYIHEHRYVACEAMGRILQEGEVVHHINLNKGDNSVTNLAVLPDNIEHRHVHHYIEQVGIYLLGLTPIRPEPLAFKAPVFWGGKYITTIDLIAESGQAKQFNAVQPAGDGDSPRTTMNSPVTFN